MKTTIDLPEAVLHRAKIAAAQRKTTLKDLVITGLEWAIRSPNEAANRDAALKRLHQGFRLGGKTLTRVKRMNANRFLDTNVLVYAYHLDSLAKRSVALRLVEEGWTDSGRTAISVQVLQELHVNLQRKAVSQPDATQIVRDFATWPIVDNTLDLFLAGLTEQKRWKISLWDALILAAARASGATELVTEDFNHGQDYSGVRALNPFR